MTSPIRMRGITKKFGRFTALDMLDLDVDTGATHGFLGPNGAGKSTTIRILLGLLRADAGSVSVLGGDPWRDAVALHRDIAYVPGDVTLWPTLSGGECIDLLTRMRGAKETARRAELIERLDLDPTKRAKAYSKGNRQKVALVAAFASPAKLLILDEPTSGLDPLMEVTFQALVREAAADGTTVLLSSHLLAEVEALCDRITIIRHGRAVTTGTLEEMRRLTVTKVSAVTQRPVLGLGRLPGVQDLRVYGRTIEFRVASGHVGPAVDALAAAGVVNLVCEPPSLEELFLEHYETKESAVLAGMAPQAARGEGPWE